MALLINNFNVNVDPTSVDYGGSWAGGCDRPYSWDLITLCYEKLQDRKDSVMFDIGANTGSFSLLPVAKKDLKVYSFEPNKMVFDILEKNVKLNNLENNVHIYNIAISDFIGESQLKIPTEKSYSGLSCLGDPKRYEEFEVCSVQTLTLDNFVDTTSIHRIDLIKIDTEGNELFVLKGAVEAITKFKPMILIEYYEQNTAQFGYSVNSIDDFFSCIGYVGSFIGKDDKFFTPA